MSANRLTRWAGKVLEDNRPWLMVVAVILLLFPVLGDIAYAQEVSWAKKAGGQYSEAVAGIAVDGSGNVYVIGDTDATWNGPGGESPLHAFSENSDFFVVKLNSSGVYQWHTFYGSSAEDYGYSIAVDGSGDVYVTGECSSTWSGSGGESPLHAYSGSAFNDLFVLKLSSAGAYQWHTFYGSTVDDHSQSVAVDGSGNVYLAGYSSFGWDGPGGESPLHAHSESTLNNLLILKLSSDGAYQWHTFYGSSSYNYSSSAAVDVSGNVYATSHSYGNWNGPGDESPLHAHSGTGWDVAVLKLDSSGAYQWHTFYGSPSDDLPYSVAVDGSGSAYVTGRSEATWSGPGDEGSLHSHSGFWDVFVLKLSAGGSYQWHTFYGVPSAYDYGVSNAIGGIGDVYVTGHSGSTWTGPSGESPLHAKSGDWTTEDLFVLKLAQ